MEHTIKLHTRENGSFVVKTVATDKYFTVCPYQVGDDDLEEVEVLSVSDLYLMWQELKAGDKSCGENCWILWINPLHNSEISVIISISFVLERNLYYG